MVRPVENFTVDDPAKCEAIKVGDRVKSYDFMAYDDTFVIGIVSADDFMMEGCNRYVIRVVERWINGEQVQTHSGEACFPPVNGTPKMLGGYTNGVRKI